MQTQMQMTQPSFFIRRFHKYCWTHGACAHDSPHCNNKNPGHKNEATFQDEMGGNTANCNQSNMNSEWRCGSDNQLINNTHIINYSGTSVDPPSNIIAKADTGVSNHYFRTKDIKALLNIKPHTNGPSVLLPDSTTISATAHGTLPLHPSLTPQSTLSHIFDNLTNSSLISIGQLCDDDCIVIFDKNAIHILKNNQCILRGTRNTSDGLWDIKLPHNTLSSPSTSDAFRSMNIIIQKDQSKSNLAQYLYSCCGSPPVSTFLKAARNGNLITWPTIDEVAKERF